jgi:hypothetical protein
VEPKGKPRCTYAPYSYTSDELYRHFPKGNIEKGDVIITCVGVCTEDTPVCNGLRARLAALSRDERHALLDMAHKVDAMLTGAITK